MASRRVELGGEGWQLGCAPATARPDKASWDEIEAVGEWLPAVVPGNVRADLWRAGRLPDLTFGTQFEASRWVDDHCWWLVRDLYLEASATERVHLVLRGVDYIADLFFNGHHLGGRQPRLARRRNPALYPRHRQRHL